MTLQEEIRNLGVRAKAASRALRAVSTDAKNAALEAIATALEEAQLAILAANEEDVAAAKANGLSSAMLDRLTLTPARFTAMVAGVRAITKLPDPVGEIIWQRERAIGKSATDNSEAGLTIRKVREPFGVVAVVFESRPNVFVDTASLCLKTSNAIILRGGKEALRSNKALNAAVREGLQKAHMPMDAVQLVEATDHAGVTELVRLVGLVDVAIPRGGERLIRAMCEAALVPVLKHYKGVCHIYVDEGADLDMALAIIDNAKTQRPGTCNAAECLLVNAREAAAFLPRVRTWAAAKNVILHENNQEWSREFLAFEMNVGLVDDVAAAIQHINAYGSGHSDAIITRDSARAAIFQRDVDSAAVYWNCSTRFTDGGEFGMGAEIGISTDKLHARGPMGLEELTTYKYTITGNGVIRA